jgi:hypothetical protein
MNVIRINNGESYAMLLRSLSSGAQSNNKRVSLEETLIKSQTTVNGFDVLTLSPEAMKKLGSGGNGNQEINWLDYAAPVSEAAKQRMANRQPIGSGAPMLTEEGRALYEKMNPPKPAPYSEEWFAAKQAEQDQYDKNLHADDGWRHHDNGMTRYEFYKAYHSMTATSDTYYKHYNGAQSMEESEWQLMDNINIILQHEGITLNDNEKLTVTTQKKADGSYGYVFVGIEDEAKLKKIQTAFSDSHVIDGKIMGFDLDQFSNRHLLNSAWVQEGETFSEMQERAYAIRVKDGIERANSMFAEFDFSKLKKNEDGTYEGYPPRFEWLFKGQYDKNPPASNTGAITMLQIANNILPTIDLMLKYGYDNILAYDKGSVNVTISNKGAAYSY